MHETIKTTVRQFITENFIFREDQKALADDASFLEAGLIDSTGVLELVCFLESDFKIQVEDEEMLPKNLDSISAIALYLQSKRAFDAPLAGAADPVSATTAAPIASSEEVVCAS